MKIKDELGGKTGLKYSKYGDLPSKVFDVLNGKYSAPPAITADIQKSFFSDAVQALIICKHSAV
jgi:hypothetical protein